MEPQIKKSIISDDSVKLFKHPNGVKPAADSLVSISDKKGSKKPIIPISAHQAQLMLQPSNLLALPPAKTKEDYNSYIEKIKKMISEKKPIEENTLKEFDNIINVTTTSLADPSSKFSNFLLKIKDAALKTIGYTITSPQLKLTSQKINKLEHQFSFHSIPDNAKKLFSILFSEDFFAGNLHNANKGLLSNIMIDMNSGSEEKITILKKYSPYLKTIDAGYSRKLAFDKSIAIASFENSANGLTSIETTAIEKLIHGKPVGLSELPDAAFPIITFTFKERLANGETVDDIMPEAFAVAREAARRTTFMRPYDVQVMAGIALHNGVIAEMPTGEGKTLAAVLPTYLNALTGKGAHVITVNDYLAQRDADWMGPAYKLLGLNVGVVTSAKSPEEKKEAYKADITYVTNHEVVFDYLRDNLVMEPEQRMQRGLNFCIIDEADLILIDEARTPCIIASRPEEEPSVNEETFAKIAENLHGYEALEEDKKYEHVPDEIDQKYDYVFCPRSKRIIPTTKGIKIVEKELKIRNLYSVNYPSISYLENALSAKEFYKEDVNYWNQNGNIILVDEFTGRAMQNRRLTNGLHRAIEAKEKLTNPNVTVKAEDKTSATITVQNFFKLYNKRSGMTGTAMTEAQEFAKMHDLAVIQIPPNKPSVRINHSDLIYKNKEDKWRKVTTQILQNHIKEQPTLVGTVSVSDSELLSNRLAQENLKKQALVNLLSNRIQIAENNKSLKLNLDKKTIHEIKDYFCRPLPELSEETLGEIAQAVGIDSRVLTDSNLEGLLQLWQIQEPLQKENVTKTERKMAHETIKEKLSSLLKNGVSHSVLNAKQNSFEAQIISQAGRLGAVAIATNMAGRGTDIKLGGDPAIFFQPQLATATKEAVLNKLQGAYPKAAQYFKDIITTPKLTMSQDSSGELIIFFGEKPVSYIGIISSLTEATIGKRPDFNNSLDLQISTVIDMELQRFLSDRSSFPLELIRGFLPGKISLDYTELLKVITQEAKNGKPWNELKNSPNVQQTISKTLGELGNSPIIEGVLAQIPQAVSKAKKEGELVKDLGGLYVLGTERHESRRIDNQLAGRAGRQGDPGETRFITSLEDSLLRLYGDAKVNFLKKQFEMFGITNGEGAEAKILDKAIGSAQEQVQNIHFGIRERLLKYDEAINKQREIIYQERDNILFAKDTKEIIKKWVEEVIKDHVNRMDKPVPQHPDIENAKNTISLSMNAIGADIKSKIQYDNPNNSARNHLEKAAQYLEDCFRVTPEDSMFIFKNLQEMEIFLHDKAPIADKKELQKRLYFAVKANKSNAAIHDNLDKALKLLQSSPHTFIPDLENISESLIEIENPGTKAKTQNIAVLAQKSNNILSITENISKKQPDYSILLKKTEEILEKAKSVEKYQNDKTIQLNTLISIIYPLLDWSSIPENKLMTYSKEKLKNILTENAIQKYTAVETAFNKQNQVSLHESEKNLILGAIDQQWVEHLTSMDALKDGIGYEAYGDKDPELVYRKYADEAFNEMIPKIKEQALAQILNTTPPPAPSSPLEMQQS